MKVGSLVRYKHFPDETGIVIKIYSSEDALSPNANTIDLLLPTGEIASFLDSDAFEVIA